MQVDNDFTHMHDIPLESKPCTITFTSKGQYLYIGNTCKEVDMYTADGLFLSTVAKKESWVWAVASKPHSDAGLLQFACGCEDGSVSYNSVSISTIHSLYKVRNCSASVAAEIDTCYTCSVTSVDECAYVM